MLRFWLGEDDRNMVVSAMAQIEARSTVCRLRKEGRMSKDEAFATFASVSAQLRRLLEQPVNRDVLDAASGLVDRHTLRALDAIQLVSAVVARNLMSASDMRFIASDHALLHAAHEEGFETWDPETA